MDIKIQAYYLPAYQPDTNEQNKTVTITLLVTDADSRKKIDNTARALTGHNSPKTPLQWNRGGWLFPVKVPTNAYFEMGGEPCTMDDLLGSIVNARITLRKYAFRSKYEKNQGQLVIGVTATLIRLYSDV